MTIKFSYPTVASPTTEVVLGDIEQLPSSRPYRKHQTAFDTDAGGQVVYDWGSEIQVFNVALWPLTIAERDALIDFYRTTVNGREKAFQFLDSDGVTYDVRFAQDVIESARRVTTHNELAVTLRVV